MVSRPGGVGSPPSSVGSGTQSQPAVGRAHAAVHDHRQAAGFGNLASLVRLDSQLQPQDVRAGNDCLMVDPWNVLGAARVFATAGEVTSLAREGALEPAAGLPIE